MVMHKSSSDAFAQQYLQFLLLHAFPATTIRPQEKAWDHRTASVQMTQLQVLDRLVQEASAGSAVRPTVAVWLDGIWEKSATAPNPCPENQ